MANETGYNLDRNGFLKRYNHNEESLRKGGLEWSVLEAIYTRHLETAEELRYAADYVSSRLQTVPFVHSLKVRIKDAEHLIEKIIRKKSSKPDLEFGVDSYETIITDLTGIRALHLFKDDWRQIHKFVTETWELHETPLAYVREGDPKVNSDAFREAGCEVQEHPFGYRSIHYVLKTQPAKCIRLVELQVRTIFEEGWSEIDHRVRYPRQSDNPYLAGFLTIFNRLAGAADEMGTFTKELNAYIHVQAEQAAEGERRIKQNEEELKKAVSQLKISEEEKTNLEQQIAELRPHYTPVTETLLPGLLASIRGAPPDASVLPLFAPRECSVCKQRFTPTFFSSSDVDKCPSCSIKGITGFLRSLSPK